MHNRREILATIAGAIGVAGCTEEGENPTGTSEQPSADSDGESAANETESNGTEEESVEDETDEEGTADDDSPDCATTVTIESGGMEPNLSRSEEVCIVQYDSYMPVENPEETGVITVETGEEIGYEKLGGTGDIIRYYPDGDEEGTPVLARAVRWEDGSYVTKGDRNSEPYPWDAPVESIIGVVRTTLE
ncbi:S26 family signal peptidase [Halovenus sp. HT40]|uniref:S26 family signal peptidase n=1 Tax=Halovenus sp. HT40 TaxID=3126691 RepID=UPI00300ED598